MKLEFNPQAIPDTLFHELDIKGYLSLFNIEMPVLPLVRLNLLRKKDGIAHFDRLKTLETKIASAKIDLKTIIAKSSKLPFIEYVMPFFRGKTLEPYHLHSLGHFVTQELDLMKLEKKLPVMKDYRGNEQIIKILKSFTTNKFSGMRLSKSQIKLKNEVEALDHELIEAIVRCEKKIHHETGLKMIHPYPKEIYPDDHRLDSIRSCDLLFIVDKGETLLVDYQLSEETLALIRKKQKKDDTLTASFDTTLTALNNALHPLYKEFQKYYEKRKDRTYAYTLLWAKKRHGLCFPDFHESTYCCLENGILPVLKKNKGKSYIPLNLKLKKGANVLFGANMTGKTSVLKTLYFHLTAVKAGLPVPATSFSLTFPEEVAIHLKSSGTISSGLSGFGEEVTFFCRNFSKSAYILVDELFQSTDPVTGSILSEIMLKEFSPKRLFFFCTSHYPDVLEVKGPSFFRMKDFPLNRIRKMDFQQLLLNVPYEIEKIPMKNMAGNQAGIKKSLAVALMFPLPDAIKNRISDKLQKKGSHGRNSN